MTVSISPVPRKQYEDSNGNPLVGGKLFYYAAGSTTKQNTYTTSAGSVANANPIILDSEGRTPYPVWFTDGLAYKEVLAPSTDTDPPTSGITMGDNLLGSGASTTVQSEWIAQSLTATYISAASFSVAGDQTTEFHVGRRIKVIVSGGTVYGFITSSVYSALTTITLQVDSTIPLDAGLSAVSLGMLSAVNPSVPNAQQVFNSVNKILNGKFVIAQAGTSFAAATTAAYDLDGWLNAFVGAAVMTISQDTASLPTGETYTRKVVFTTPDAAIAAGDFCVQKTRIEGYECIDLINSTFTVGFWVRSAVTGIHDVSFYNGTSSYISEYTINVANTWEYKTVTVIGGTPALASSTNAYGLEIRFANSVGSTFQTTAGAWQAGNYYGTASQVNDTATISNTFYLANVTLNLGTVPVVNQYNYGFELIRCKRYYNKFNIWLNSYAAAGTAFGGSYPWPVIMAAAPTVNLSGGAYTNASGIAAASISVDQARITAIATALGSAAYLGWSVECLSRM